MQEIFQAERYSQKRLDEYDSAFRQYFFVSELLEQLRQAEEYFTKNTMIYPADEVRKAYDKATEFYRKQVEEFNKKQQDIEREISDIPPAESRPVLIAASWTALAINDINSALDRASQNKRNEQLGGNLGYLAGIREYFMKCVSRNTMEQIEVIVKHIQFSFKQQMIRIEGDAENNEIWKKWLEESKNPSAYVDLIKNLEDACCIRNLMVQCGITNELVYAECITQLSKRISKMYVRDRVDENQEIVQRWSCFFDKSKREIIHDALSQYVEAVLGKLSELCKKLPVNTKRIFESHTEILNEATLLLEYIILPEDYQFIQEIYGAEWTDLINEKCGLNAQASEQYGAINDLIQGRIEAVHNCLLEKEHTISKLEKEKAEAEKELKETSIFASAAKKKLKQQIEQIEREIKATNAACDQKIGTM